MRAATIALVVRQIHTSGVGTWRGARVLADALPVLALVGVTVGGIRGRPFSFTLYLVGLAVLCLTSPIVIAQFPDALAGGGRFVLAAVPLWLQVGRWTARHTWLDTSLVFGGLLTQALLEAFVVTGGWFI